MQFGFSTLGQPELSFDESCVLAEEFGLDFVELRALGDSLDLPAHFPGGERIEITKPVRVIASSLRLISADAAAIETLMDFAELASRMDCPYVRVFGDGVWGTPVTEEEMDRACETVMACRKGIAARGLDVTMLLETHSAFCDFATCIRLNDRLNDPLLILWDAHNSWQAAGESLAETWAQLGKWVRHIHYKDSVMSPGADKFQYVFPGEGEFPTRELLSLIKAANYTGGVSLEWEKKWHPELPSLRDALAAFRRVIKEERLSRSSE